MHYLLLIYHSEADWGKMKPEEQEPIYGQYRQLITELTGKGKYLGGHQLKPTGTATTLRLRDGKRLVTDGPFAETREQLGGYFLAIAARIPAAKDGSIEIRPIVVHEQAKTA